MCGIFGVFGNYDNDKLYSLFMKIKKRGKHKSVYIEGDDYKVGFHRLSIIDKSINGDQPFAHHTNNRDIYAICNGEIYNYKKFKKQYENSYNFKSNSDCEVLIPLYLEYGINFIKQLDGEFSFAIYDFDLETGYKKLYLGTDHLGMRPLFYTIYNNSLLFCSEMKGLILDNNRVERFKPCHYMKIDFKDINNNSNDLIFEPEYKTFLTMNYNKYFDLNKIKPLKDNNLEKIFYNIRKILRNSVELRLQSDQEVGALLSGGLDSSLLCAIASDILKEKGKKLKTFCIGIKGSPDIECSKKVAEYIGSEHTIIEISQNDMLDALETVIYEIETYDTTTIRASVGQYMISKWISENTDIKVVIVGDISDELTSGYLYFHNSPDENFSHRENIKLLETIHYFDGLRADRGTSSHDLEVRLPYGSKNFIEYYLSIEPKLRVPKDGVEKWLLRNSYKNTNILPNEILFRTKEAFSDGISSNEKSWFEIIQDKVNLSMSDRYFNSKKTNYNINQPKTKEALYYREIFDKYYINQDHIIPFYWMPNWDEDGVNDPSARKLKIYKDLENK